MSARQSVGAQTHFLGSGNCHELPSLLEISIKGEYLLDAQACHHRETGAIGEAELLVTVLLEEAPSFCFILWRDMGNSRILLIPERLTSLHSGTVPESK